MTTDFTYEKKQILSSGPFKPSGKDMPNDIQRDKAKKNFCCCLFAFSRAAPTAYGGSQARGQIGAMAAGLCQSHSNVGSKPHLQPTPQLTATLDP